MDHDDVRTELESRYLFHCRVSVKAFEHFGQAIGWNQFWHCVEDIQLCKQVVFLGEGGGRILQAF